MNYEVNQHKKKADEEAIEGITSIIVKGRKEQEKQRLYLCRLNSIQFEMKYSGNKISELRIMIKELKEDDEDEAETISSIKKLKIELATWREKKDKLFITWQHVRDAELERRTAIDVNDDSDGPIDIITTSVMPSVMTAVTDVKSPSRKRKVSTVSNDVKTSIDETEDTIDNTNVDNNDNDDKQVS